MKRTMIKALALLLTVVLILPSLSVYAAVTDDQKSAQIVKEGGQVNNIETDPIELSKTLTPTGIENYLDVTLTVKTKQEVSKIYDGTAIVIVLDISNTMSEYVDGTTERRIDKMNTAIKNFIDKYYDGSSDAKRDFAIVAFNTNATTKANMADYSGNTSVLKNVLSDIRNIVVDENYKSSHERFTNIEAGLLLAQNLLNKSDAMNKFIILATDGFPTTYSYRSGGNYTAASDWKYNISDIQNYNSTTEIKGYCPYMDFEKCLGKNCLHGGTNKGDIGFFYNGLIGVTGSKYYCVDENCGHENGVEVRNGENYYHVHNANGKTISALYGTSYSDAAAWAAQNAAEQIKLDGTTIFSIGVDLGGQTIRKYLDQDMANETTEGAEKTPNLIAGFSVMDFPGEHTARYEPIIGINKDDYGKWLGNKIGGSTARSSVSGDKSRYGNFYTDTTEMGYDTVFSIIENYVEEIVGTASKGKWVVADPIPSPYEYIGFFNDGVLGSTLPKGVSVDTTNGAEISWDLKTTKCTTETVGNETRYVYTVKYRIRVETELSGFVSNSEKATNGNASITWDKWNSSSYKWEQQSPLEFPIPSAKGYLGEFEFKKVDSDGVTAIEGVEFELKHSENCTVCKAADNNVSVKTMTAKSGSDGKVIFTNIPSGHDYILSEKTPADGYKDYKTTHNVSVAYGVTTVDGNSASAFTSVKNEKIEPTEVVLSVSKTFDENAPKEYSFEFAIYNDDGEILKDKNGNEYKVTVTDKNNPASFAPIVYDEWSEIGEHDYIIKEIVPTATSEKDGKLYDDKYVYDSSSHAVNVKVGVNSERTEYTAKVTLDGTENKTVAVFYNEYINPAELVLTATKSLEGTEQIADGIFSFSLKDENGNVIETVTNKGNTVTFGKLTYNKLGTYKYSVCENRGDNLSILYDRTCYDINVEVVHNKDMTAYETIVTVTNGSEAVEKLSFNNALRKPVEVVLKAKKTVNNVKPGKKTFEFELKDEDGNIVSTVKNDSEGNVVFDKLVFNEVGTYRYTMSEKDRTDGYIICDRRVYDVEITVTANATTDDPFTATVAITRKGKTYEYPTFRNLLRTPPEDPETEEKNPTTGAFVGAGLSGTVLMGSLTLAKIIYEKKRK